MRERIEGKLTHALQPTRLEVVDESHKHQGHIGARPGGETHFHVEIAAQAFAGVSRVARHRLVNAALTEEFAHGVHALSILARAPGEA